MNAQAPAHDQLTSNWLSRGWRQFQTLIWLRWRIFKNQMAKSGRINLILTMLIVWCCLATAASSFFIALGLGVALLPSANPFHAMVIWDVLIVGFCFLWLIGLITELQRTEFLSITKLLQLPMSFQGAFTLNYLTSLAALSVLLFLPTALGLGLAFAIVHGPLMLLQIPMALLLVFMVSSLSYLFRSWLGTIMQNERKRRRVVVFLTFVIIAVSQLPNLLIQSTKDFDEAPRAEFRSEQAALQQKMDQGEIDAETYQTEQDSLTEKLKEQLETARQANFARWERYLNLANTWIPIGWPAMTCKRLMERDVRMFLVGSWGLLSISAGAFGLSYRATMRSLTKADAPTTTRPVTASKSPGKRRRNWLQIELPMVRTQPAAVQLATTINLLRTPEAKMGLIVPVIMMVVFASLYFFRRTTISIPSGMEPFAHLAVVGMLFFAATFYCMNLFGMDRNGFKSLVLMPVPRREILLGKNLAPLPLGLLVAVLMLLMLCFIVPVSPITFVATLLQVLVIYIGMCLISNPISIWFPIPITPGTGQPTNVNFKVVVMQMLATMACSLLFVPAGVAIALEGLLLRAWQINCVPIYLLVGLIELPIAIAFYRWGIAIQGAMLQERETHIVEVLKVGQD